MIQAVIPTLCISKKEIFSFLLQQLNNCNIVSKIIIVDNTNNCIFKTEYKEYLSNKIQIIENGFNNYVNPSWNQGLEQVDSEYYLILNDDLAVHSRIFYIIEQAFLENEGIGLLTVKTVKNMPIKAYSICMDQLSQDSPQYTLDTDMMHPSGIQGWFIAGRRKDWKPIPDEFKVWYGDNIIFNRCKEQGQKSLRLGPYFINHFESSSVDHAPDLSFRQEIQSIISQEYSKVTAQPSILYNR